MAFPHNKRFPEVYTGDKLPYKVGYFDKERQAAFPVYIFGWVLPRRALYELIYERPCTREFALSRISKTVDQQFYDPWTAKGYDKNEYNPSFPTATNWGPEHIVIYLSCNESPEIIESISNNKKYHDACRECMNHMKEMEIEPAWIRGDLKRFPKGLTPSVVSD